MDEGLQLGGGRKQCKKFFRPESLKQSNFYRIRSDNLELVTIIECISPSGLSILLPLSSQLGRFLCLLI